MVVAPKKDGSILLCADFRMTLNQAIKYPLPLVEDIFASLGGSTMLSKVDLRHVYLQMKLEEQARNSAPLIHIRGYIETTDSHSECLSTGNMAAHHGTDTTWDFKNAMLDR